ncbi:unnamed protein product [Nesidiocoris tenuis]|uniref:Uncharacterized protein n=1 Tax=Nesidiocoris tenuis TaxID=355587 RepID=A0A6H5GNS0_9HEMI|nr:unnamed protein product [Nesidiocoris tenuis]
MNIDKFISSHATGYQVLEWEYCYRTKARIRRTAHATVNRGAAPGCGTQRSGGPIVETGDARHSANRRRYRHGWTRPPTAQAAGRRRIQLSNLSSRLCPLQNRCALGRKACA